MTAFLWVTIVIWVITLISNVSNINKVFDCRIICCYVGVNRWAIDFHHDDRMGNRSIIGKVYNRTTRGNIGAIL